MNHTMIDFLPTRETMEDLWGCLLVDRSLMVCPWVIDDLVFAAEALPGGIRHLTDNQIKYVSQLALAAVLECITREEEAKAKGL